MKRILLITLCVSMFTVANVMFGVSIGQEIGEGIADIGSRVLGVSTFQKVTEGPIQKVAEGSIDALRTSMDYMPLATSKTAFISTYSEASRLIGRLTSEKISLDQKKHNIDRIIKLSNDMVDIMTPVVFRLKSSVQNLRAYIQKEADRIKALEPEAIKKNDFKAISNIAEKLIEYLSEKLIEAKIFKINPS